MRQHIRLFAISLIICSVVILSFSSLTGCNNNKQYEAQIQQSIAQAEQARSAEGIAQARSEAERARANAEAQMAQAESVTKMAEIAASVQINAQDNQHELAITYADSQVLEINRNGKTMRYIAEHTYRTQDKLMQWAWITLLVGVVCYAITKGITTTIPDAACKLCKYRRQYHAVAKVANGQQFDNEDQWGA